jgi:inhibitor of cysteine peptidase
MENEGPLTTLALILWCAVSGCSGGSLKMITLDQAANNTEVILTVGQEVEIVLPENPTTGYRWEIQDSGEPVCSAIANRFDAPSAGTPGRGGVRHWQFRAERAGSCRIDLIYQRASDREARPAQTFSLTARVQ